MTPSTPTLTPEAGYRRDPAVEPRVTDVFCAKRSGKRWQVVGVYGGGPFEPGEPSVLLLHVAGPQSIVRPIAVLSDRRKWKFVGVVREDDHA